MTYRECYEKGCLALQTAGIEEATLDARLLLEAVCGTNRNDLLVHGEQSVTPEAEEKYLGWIGQRAEHIPLQQRRRRTARRFRMPTKLSVPRI